MENDSPRPNDSLTRNPHTGTTGLRSLPVLCSWLLLLAAVMALLEIQIEGSGGWAANLPTWRISTITALRWLMGGREITGYHTFLFTFVALVFHLPQVIQGRFSLRVECRILSSLMLFWTAEDVLWFVLNPVYGITRLTPQYACWHPHWWLGVPVDYLVFMLAGWPLLIASYRPNISRGDDP